MRNNRLVGVGVGLFGILATMVACSSEDTGSDPSAPAAHQTDPSLGAPAAAGTAEPAAAAPVPECTTDAECKGRGPANFCTAPRCEGGRCVQKILQPAGTKLPSQRYGDCLERQCGEAGAIVDVPTADVFDDGNECTESICKSGLQVDSKKAQGSLCTYGICAAAGTCVQCIPGVQSCTIAGQICIDGFCAGATCTNGVKDAGESDIDCGGPCPKCAVTKNCISNLQCASGSCKAGKCANPTCSDNVRNGDETEVDCGGSTCAPCATDAPCKKHSDCLSQNCTENFCAAPSCTDAVKNGDETGVDCGGSCAACP